MVEECQVDGFVGCGGHFLGVFVCWVWVWIAGLGKVYWVFEVRGTAKWRERRVCGEAANDCGLEKQVYDFTTMSVGICTETDIPLCGFGGKTQIETQDTSKQLL